MNGATRRIISAGQQTLGDKKRGHQAIPVKGLPVVETKKAIFKLALKKIIKYGPIDSGAYSECTLYIINILLNFINCQQAWYQARCEAK